MGVGITPCGVVISPDLAADDGSHEETLKLIAVFISAPQKRKKDTYEFTQVPLITGILFRNKLAGLDYQKIGSLSS